VVRPLHPGQPERPALEELARGVLDLQT